MASAALKEQLNGLISSMFAEGLLDQQFQQLQMLQDQSCPGFVAEVLTLFCDDSDRILGEMMAFTDHAVVDYQKVDAYVHQMKGSSSSVGAQNVSLACVQFRQSYEQNNKEGCLRALHMIKNEYYRLRGKFETMLQLEQRIQAYEDQRR